ncbi:hypothetical protein [Vibrio parahaemolyticus]|uniref:hypothetical protein n=1 Tax=Vibrio parahaemolyticus TaxID=670 RepID=UPI001FADB2DB|nr:hypothetical protein [Vibrio parahaemolyticus]MCI9718732.1 hypothetical protein [Vibrio parahaemolyticus]
MRLLTLSAAVVVALAGCQTTSQPKVSEAEKAYLDSYKTPSYIQRALMRMNESSFKMEYTESEPLKDAYLCGVTKLDMEPVDGPLAVTYYAHGQYTIEHSFPTPPKLGQCMLNKQALLQVRTDAVKAINAHMTAQVEVPAKEEQPVLQSNSIEDLYKQYGIPTPEEQEKQRIAAEEKRERERIKQEAYAKSPKGQMDRYALGSAELTVCAENLLITSTQARNGKKNLASDMKKRLASRFDQAYFNEQYKQHYNSVSNLVALNGYTTEMHQACRVAASIANQS